MCSGGRREREKEGQEGENQDAKEGPRLSSSQEGLPLGRKGIPTASQRRQGGGGGREGDIHIRVRGFVPPGLYFLSKGQRVGDAEKNHSGERMGLLTGTLQGFPGCWVAC